jgi:Asp-tRNA(Asn)/Glu-tRNA(Gln) amidotransferase A subunit family amidase
MRFTQWFNLLGMPAAVVPILRTGDELPVGVQIAGRPGQDEEVLAVARALDGEFGFRADYRSQDYAASDGAFRTGMRNVT